MLNHKLCFMEKLKKLELLKANQLLENDLKSLFGGSITYHTCTTYYSGGSKSDTSTTDDSSQYYNI